MKKPDTWMPVYPAAYLANTLHLNAAQHGGYFLLLMHGWKNGGILPLADAELQNITRMKDREWKESRGVLLAFFDKGPNGYSQDRQLEEIAKAEKMVEGKSKAGRAGAQARWQNDGRGNDRMMAEAEAEAMTEECRGDAPLPLPTPKARTKTKRDPPTAFAPPDWVPRQEWDDFDEMRRQKSGKAWTFRARELAVMELSKLKAGGEDLAAVLRQSVIRSWAGLFPLEKQRTGGNRSETAADKRAATAKAMYAHRTKDEQPNAIDGTAERIAE